MVTQPETGAVPFLGVTDRAQCSQRPACDQDANTNKNRRAVLATAFREAVADVLPVIASITAFAAIASLMDRFSMIQGWSSAWRCMQCWQMTCLHAHGAVVADFLVDGLSSAPALYALLMPFIGTWDIVAWAKLKRACTGQHLHA